MAEVGPEKTAVEIVNQFETVARLYKLISEAEKYIFLVSPYLSLDKLRTLVRHLQGALARKVQVKLVIRDKDFSTGGADVLTSEALRSLRDAGMEVRVLKDLHAKIYLSEKHALVTSLNLLESSFNNSIEVGMWLMAGTPEHRKLVEFLRREVHPTSVKVEALPEPAVLASVPEPTTRTKSKPRKDAPSPPSPDEDELFEALFGDTELEGHCIRCGDGIDFEPERPLCRDCYNVWKRYGDPDYEEEYCHACGDEYGTSVAKPLCYDCFRNR